MKVAFQFIFTYIAVNWKHPATFIAGFFSPVQNEKRTPSVIKCQSLWQRGRKEDALTDKPALEPLIGDS